MHPEYGVIKNSEDIAAVGHRVVHGGASFSDTIVIDEKVKEKIQRTFFTCATAQSSKPERNRGCRGDFPKGNANCCF